jgi:hypothetical protein
VCVCVCVCVCVWWSGVGGERRMLKMVFRILVCLLSMLGSANISFIVKTLRHYKSTMHVCADIVEVNE